MCFDDSCIPFRTGKQAADLSWFKNLFQIESQKFQIESQIESRSL